MSPLSPVLKIIPIPTLTKNMVSLRSLISIKLFINIFQIFLFNFPLLPLEIKLSMYVNLTHYTHFNLIIFTIALTVRIYITWRRCWLYWTFGHHGLRCHINPGRLSQHGELNSIIKGALQSIHVSSSLELHCLFRNDQMMLGNVHMEWRMYLRREGAP